MKEHNLNNEDFILDEIVSIEFIGEEDTIDITVDGTHMFYGNDIYTHNSSISAEIVTNDQMGGSIKKAQIGHVVISIAKTLAQKESGLATMALLKSRLGKDGIVFENCIFKNDSMLISTELSETFLGFENNRNERNRNLVGDAYARRRARIQNNQQEENVVVENNENNNNNN